MVGWYVNYYSVTRRMESRTAPSASLEGALVHARGLAIHGHIVRNIVSPRGHAFEANSSRSWYREKDHPKPTTENDNS
jgi:hypothetical protein